MKACYAFFMFDKIGGACTVLQFGGTELLLYESELKFATELTPRRRHTEPVACVHPRTDE